jgi:tripartite-type tricarboxylate transporter receptor subunit TctC
MVNPYAPGGYVDNFARAISVPLSKAFGQPVSIVNTPGADGMLGHEYFLKQPQDGYVQLADSVNSIAQSILTQHAPYKMADFWMVNLPVRDFTLLATSAKNQKLHSMDDVVRALKADPASLSIAVLPAQAD